MNKLFLFLMVLAAVGGGGWYLATHGGADKPGSVGLPTYTDKAHSAGKTLENREDSFDRLLGEEQ
ncbi:MAG: hypothetical protein OEY97_00555 [Nitrospirota bacterium]|nr:hypothetical protein [Nitrospirota bacterium]